jgi:hypothetical protein
MRVLILGAGASNKAGYPLARNLIDAVGTEARVTQNVTFQDAWKFWENYRDNTSGLIRSLVHSSNPEIVLSVPDLFEITIEAEDQHQFEKALKNLEEQTDESITEYKSYLDSDSRIQLQAAVSARYRFLICLDWFLRHWHVQDAKNPDRRTYLKELFNGLQRGDVVITLNWDTTAERTLGEAGLWNPVDGYGFSKQLVHRTHDWAEPQTLPHNFPKSEVKVLKLHGSFGWLLEQQQVVFERAGYLAHFPFKYKDEDLFLWDASESDIGTPEKFALLYPSFFKRIEISQFQMIWNAASQALQLADEVDVWGYSLPLSDTAIRVLLTPLRFRSQEGTARVTIHDPSDETLVRWRLFLGETAIYLKDKL